MGLTRIRARPIPARACSKANGRLRDRASRAERETRNGFAETFEQVSPMMMPLPVNTSSPVLF
jgi:hypothetical protein